MKIFQYKILLAFTLVVNTLDASNGLDYLNSLRIKTGLPAFSEQANLRAAAQNHSAYLETNSVTGHYEASQNEGFTGRVPVDRALSTGYSSRRISENVSYGDKTVQSSIDSLFSAIYHRFGFLDLTTNEVGLGISNNGLHYTYKMGNSDLNRLCQGDSYMGDGLYYYDICADTNKRIKESDYLSINDPIQNNAPKLIVWPAALSDDIPPVFYDESPDPLPSYDVSGYPIGLEFNPKKVTSTPTVSSFTLETALGDQVPIAKMIKHDNDVYVSDHQFVLMPEKRLEWGSKYIAEVVYSDNSNTTVYNWCFTTRTLYSNADRFYRITDDASLDVVSGKSYAIYIVPKNKTEKLTRYNASFSVTSTLDVNVIDANTLLITMRGNVGDTASFTLTGSSTNFTLTIAPSDSASAPSRATCGNDSDGDGITDENDAFPNNSTESVDTDGDGIGNNADNDDDNDGIADSVEVANGMNPLNKADADADFDNDGFSNSIELSLGSAMRNANDHPTWVPIALGDIMTIIPFYNK